MASPGELVAIVADILGVPKPTVVVHDRNLVMAGLRSKSGRGRSAAKVTAADAVNLLIAVAGSAWYHSGVKDTVATVEAYAPLQAAGSEYSIRKQAQSGVFENEWQSSSGPSWHLERLPLTSLMTLSPRHTFAEALSTIITSASDGSLIEAVAGVPRETTGGLLIKVHIAAPRPHAVISLDLFSDYVEEMHYALPDKFEAGEGNRKSRKKVRQFEDGDLRQFREFSNKTVFAIGELLRDKA